MTWKGSLTCTINSLIKLYSTVRKNSLFPKINQSNRSKLKRKKKKIIYSNSNTPKTTCLIKQSSYQPCKLKLTPMTVIKPISNPWRQIPLQKLVPLFRYIYFNFRAKLSFNACYTANSTKFLAISFQINFTLFLNSFTKILTWSIKTNPTFSSSWRSAKLFNSSKPKTNLCKCRHLILSETWYPNLKLIYFHGKKPNFKKSPVLIFLFQGMLLLPQ